jgi:hypothetical protein
MTAVTTRNDNGGILPSSARETLVPLRDRLACLIRLSVLR